MRSRAAQARLRVCSHLWGGGGGGGGCFMGSPRCPIKGGRMPFLMDELPLHGAARWVEGGGYL